MMMLQGCKSRRQFLASAAALLRPPQRVVVVMCDGFGLDYLEQSHMPVLARWLQTGLYRRVKDTMPSVTNTNNASICCGVWPEKHGITANFYLNEISGREEYMEQADMVLAPTLFERAAAHGVNSALLSSKKKTITLLPRGATLVMSAEIPEPEWVRLLGMAPDIYSADINHWLLKAALWISGLSLFGGVLWIGFSAGQKLAARRRR